MEKEKLSGFAIFIEILGWLRIAVIPLLVGCIIGFVIYGLTKTKTGLVLWIICTLIGLGLGIKWATHVWKTMGTMNFVSRIDASPDLDHIGAKTGNSDQEKKEENKD